MRQQPAAALVVAEPYLKLLATVVGGWLMGKAARLASQAIEGGSSDPFYRHKLASARFYADHLLPRSAGLVVTVQADNSTLLGLEDEAF